MEHQNDMLIGTLQAYAEALGGTVEIILNMPTGKVSVTPQFRDLARA